MSRQIFPDEASRLAYRVETSGALAGAAGAGVVVYATEAGISLANIRQYNGTGTPGDVIPGSALQVDSNSLVPLFWGPDGTDTVWVRVSGGPLTPIYARTDDRVDAIRTDVNLALALGLAL